MGVVPVDDGVGEFAPALAPIETQWVVEFFRAVRAQRTGAPRPPDNAVPLKQEELVTYPRVVTITLPTGKLQSEGADAIARVRYQGHRIRITKRGRPVAALVSVEDLEQLERQQSEDGEGTT